MWPDGDLGSGKCPPGLIFVTNLSAPSDESLLSHNDVKLPCKRFRTSVIYSPYMKLSFQPERPFWTEPIAGTPLISDSRPTPSAAMVGGMRFSCIFLGGYKTRGSSVETHQGRCQAIARSCNLYPLFNLHANVVRVLRLTCAVRPPFDFGVREEHS